MLNKRALLATSAIALLGAGQAQAGDGFYISVLGGANFQQGKTATPLFFTSDTLSPDTGFLIGGRQFRPAERPGRMLIVVSHSSLLCVASSPI